MGVPEQGSPPKAGFPASLGNVYLNDNSNSLQSIPIALHMILNPVDVHGGAGQSVWV